MAQEADLDLVEVAPESKPPVAKIMDYGKFKYEAAQKAKEARRNQANTVLKEVRFRLKIDDHDYETKRKRAIGFLGQGDKVKAMILFRGREQSRPEQGVRLLQRFAEDVAEFGSVEHTPLIDGRNMVMVIGPLKSKTDAKAEQNAKRNAAKEAARGARVGEPAAAAPAEAKPVEAAPVSSPVDTSTSSAQRLVETATPVVELVETTPKLVDASTSSAQRPVETTSPAAPVETKPAAKAPAAKAAPAKAPAAKAAPAKAPAAKAPAAKPAAAKAPAAAKPAAAKAAAKPAAAKAPAKPKTEKPAE
jgi:translation initiation factor IF-3